MDPDRESAAAIALTWRSAWVNLFRRLTTTTAHRPRRTSRPKIRRLERAFTHDRSPRFQSAGGGDRRYVKRRYFFCSANAVITSSLCLLGLTPVQTLATFPAGSIRNVLRDAIPRWFNDPYWSTTFFSVSDSSLKLSPSFA